MQFIHLDDSLLVADKPAGLLSVPGRGPDKQDCLSARIQRHYPEILVVHRLDMATSGLMLFARNKEIQRSLSQLFSARKVEKHYMAIVAGKLSDLEGEIDLPLIVDWPNRPRQKVCHINGKPSSTQYRVVEYYEQNDCSCVELKPLTGRTHQLRLHMAALGHAIIGDNLYGGRSNSRLLLHAQSLHFFHPATASILNLISPAPF